MDNEVTKLDIAVESAERLVLRDLEVAFLRLQNDANNINKALEDTQKKFTAEVEALAKKYAVNPATHTWDLIKQVFKAL